MGYNRQPVIMKKFLVLISFCCLLTATQSFVTTSEISKSVSYVSLMQGDKSPIESDCGCNLYTDDSVGYWYLKCKNTCNEMVKATCTYKIHYPDGSSKKQTVTNHIRAYSEIVVTSGNLSDNYCEAIAVGCEIVE